MAQNSGDLTENEIECFARQLILKTWGTAQQLRLRAASARLPASVPSAAIYLAAAGIGKLELIGETDTAHRLREQLQELNPQCTVEIIGGTPGDKLQIELLHPDGLSACVSLESGSVRYQQGPTRVQMPISESRFIRSSMLAGLIAAALVLRQTGLKRPDAA